MGGFVMRKVLNAACLGAMAALAAGAASANEELNKMSQDPKGWVMPAGDYANPRYSKLNENKIIWQYEPKQDPNVIPVMCCDTVNRGVAYGDGKIFLHQADTTLVALDAKTGQVAWSVKNGDPGKGSTGTSAPLVVKDKVLIGISGGEFGVQCHVTAYDLKSGKQAWR